MNAVEARVTPEELDAIQAMRAPVPLNEFRLLPDCDECNELARRPATKASNLDIACHVLGDHRHLVIV